VCRRCFEAYLGNVRLQHQLDPRQLMAEPVRPSPQGGLHDHPRSEPRGSWNGFPQIYPGCLRRVPARAGALWRSMAEENGQKPRVCRLLRARNKGARYCQPLPALRRARAVEGTYRRKADVIEQPVARRPKIPLDTLQPRQIAENALTFLPVGLALDSMRPGPLLIRDNTYPGLGRRRRRKPTPRPPMQAAASAALVRLSMVTVSGVIRLVAMPCAPLNGHCSSCGGAGTSHPLAARFAAHSCALCRSITARTSASADKSSLFSAAA
jgi:hypothetical protein